MHFLILMFIFLYASTPSVALATDKNDGWNEYTIMPEDFKNPNAPTFKKYSVPLTFHGRPAHVKLNSHPDAKTWKTRLVEGAKEGPNFADNMTVIAWGCGTNCTSIAFVDARNGKVYFDKKLAALAWVNLHDKVIDNTLSYKRDSRLLIAAGCPNEECSTRRGVFYFIWTGNGLNEVFNVHRKWYPRDN